MNDSNIFETRLMEMLDIAGLPKKPSYHPGEVCQILQISDRTFWRLTSCYEPDQKTGRPIKPYSLDSYSLARSRRVRYTELVDFLSRNSSYERSNAMKDDEFEKPN